MERMSYRTERLIQIVVDLVAIVIVFIIFGLVYVLVEPKTAYFSCNDSNEINYPNLSDTIPFWAVGIYCILGPLIVIVLVELKSANYCMGSGDERSKAQKTKDLAISLFHALSLFALGMGITLLLTEIGKRWVGRLRPCFLSICNPDLSSITCTTNGVYNTISTGGSFCQTSAKTVQDARFSWPSGHSSFSFYCMIFLILYLEARLRLLKLRYFKALLQMAAAITAFLTSISRISDYKHRFSDVVSGACLGTAVALFTTLVLGRVLWVLDEKPRRFEIKHDASH